MWDKIVILGHEKTITDEIGDLINVITYDCEIFCNEKSVRASEFYQAQAIGMKPELVLEVMALDYNKEKYVKFEDEEYTVLRTYKVSRDKIELTLVRGIN